MYSYIHIPFCDSKCKYCRFASIWKTNEILIQKYLSHLLNDIKNYKTDLHDKSVLAWLKSIYFWWWTPSILKPYDLNKIIKELKNKFDFWKNIEITLETTPWNITIENIKWWEEIWINRLSIWVQTLNKKALREIWREDKWTILNSLELLKKSKIKNISIDFIIWLPYVKKWEILKDIKYLLKKFHFINHISVYMLEDYYEANKDENNYEKITYPWDWNNLWIKEEEYLWEYLNIRKFLEKKWFEFYEISNSSKKWFECKHNKAYWNHKDVIWFWLWSHSFVNNIRYAYVSDFIWYYAWKKDYEEKLEKNDILLEKILFSLRTKWIWKLEENKLNKEKIKDLINLWFLKRGKNKLKLWEKWFPVIDFIIKEII